ncbi:olfactory receptor 2AG1 [Aplochiton taeniatus]
MVPTLICTMVLLTLLSLVVNGFTLFGIGRSEDLSWEPRYTLLKNLILSDLLQTISVGPPVTHSLVHRRTMSFNGWCLIQYFGGCTSIFCSIITITFMALERYLYVCHAISYLTILTPRRLRVAVSLTWAISLSISCINMTLLHMGEETVPGRATVGLMCEPDSVEQQMGFPRPAAIFRKATGSLVLLICLLSYIFAYLRLYHAAHNAVAPFNVVNTRARNTVLFYSGMLFFQLLPAFVKVASDTLWELEGTGAMVTQLDALPNTAPSLSAGVFHIFLLGMMMVPPCINPLVFGLRNWEVRQVLLRVFWYKRGKVDSDMAWADSSLFGKETADYYLLPERDLLTDSPYWYKRMMQDMGDQVSAVSLWDAMRERNSLHTLTEERDVAGKVMQLCVDWEAQKDRGPLRRLAGVRKMFQLAQNRQAFSTLLLHSKPPLLPYEPLTQLDNTVEETSATSSCLPSNGMVNTAIRCISSSSSMEPPSAF